MSFTLTIGAWIVPLLGTITALTWSFWERPSDYGGFIPSPMPLVRLAGAVIASLTLWLIYLGIMLWRA